MKVAKPNICISIYSDISIEIVHELYRMAQVQLNKTQTYIHSCKRTYILVYWKAKMCAIRYILHHKYARSTWTRQDSTSMAKHTIHFHALLRFPLWRSISALFHITKRCYFVKLYRRCKIRFSSVCCTEAIGWSVLILNILVFVCWTSQN